jgi:hypothetical protein
LTRACIAGLGTLDRTTSPAAYARPQWDDRNVDPFLRAAVSPATVAGTPELAHVAISLLETFVPMSVGADLLARRVGLAAVQLGPE